jgi:hypothetical protein
MLPSKYVVAAEQHELRQHALRQPVSRQYSSHQRLDWRQLLRCALVSGTVASIASTVVLTVAVQLTGKPPASGTNATSQWVWGRSAWWVRRADLRHTAVGYLIHHASSVWWALAFEALNAWRPPARHREVLLRASAVSATAALVDYRLIPKRLTPGFEAHLGRKAITCVYAAFAAGLAFRVAGRGRGRR